MHLRFLQWQLHFHTFPYGQIWPCFLGETLCQLVASASMRSDRVHERADTLALHEAQRHALKSFPVSVIDLHSS